MSRSVLTNCVLGLLLFGPAARLWADQLVPQRPVSPQCMVLEGLIGTWDAQLSGGSAEAFDKPISIGRVTRQWVADHKFVQERGREHEAFITFDPRQNMYREWCFHSNGHVWELTGRWTGNTDRVSLSAELDQNQSITRNFQLQGNKNHECTVTWTDENGRIGLYGTLSFTRCDPASTEGSGKKPKPAAEPKPSPPAELKIFDDRIGKWTLEAATTSDEKTTKITGSSVVQWILGGQFMQTKETTSGREGESIGIAGFDQATKTYRCWYFDANGAARGPVTGAWDEKERTMTWKDQLSADLLIVSKKQWINRDTAKIHVVCSRRNGTVTSTMDGTITRQEDK